jgi:hypothetical protein
MQTKIVALTNDGAVYAAIAINFDKGHQARRVGRALNEAFSARTFEEQENKFLGLPVVIEARDYDYLIAAIGGR